MRALVLLVLLATHSAAADLPNDWAFQKPTRPAVPAKAKHPVDAFLLAKLDAAKLTYAALADKRTLLRRVTFDLTGLPPTPEEVAAFLKDDSPDAYVKVVNRLLASPRFGERAALFWLDVVRFAESDGYKSDDFRPSAWRYRDYVIQSFNADKPYDRFVQEQLAGDELFPTDTAALVATGFLRHAPYEYNAVNIEQKRQDYLNDITDTTGATFLGLTLGCAKCHDHKTDPVTQHDYYRMQAFFAGYWPTEKLLGTPEQVAAAERKRQEWEAKTADLRKQLDELEQSAREKATAKERSRFAEEYQQLLDIPVEKRTPLQRQLAMIVEKQVYVRNKVTAAQMKGPNQEKWEGMTKRMAEFEKEKPSDLPTAFAMTDVGPDVPPTRLLKRGDWKKPAELVVPGYLSEITDEDAEFSATPHGTTGRRAALAKWITQPGHPLTARVMVNRIWQQLFGRGIVPTPGDFGVTGDKPTHPELLDYLASEFMANGWKTKAVYRLIVTSKAYQQASVADHGAKVDSENYLLWRMPRKRLDGEALRDAMLAVSGQLNTKTGGPSIYPELPEELKAAAGKWPVSAEAERNRRSVYVAVKRNLRYPFFALFDSPDRSEVCSRRFVTTTAPQALTLLNDKMVLGYAKTFAAKVAKDADPAARAFEMALGRTPTPEERTALTAFLAKPGVTLVDLCHTLLNISEFAYVD